MNRKLWNTCLCIAIVAVVVVLSPFTPSRGEDAQDEIGQAAARFYGALNAMFTGEVRPMLDVWSHSDDVTYMGPFGKILVGWEEVKASWERQADLKLGGRVEARDLHTVASGDLGVTVGFEQGTNYKEGKPVDVSIRATNVFRRENGEWKMIGHHTDIFPWLNRDGGGS